MEGKGNDGKGNNPERDLWQTEQEFWDKLNSQYSFSFDCCASKENTKCEDFSTDFETEWEGKHRAWMNPPFSDASNMFKHFFKIVSSGVAIFRCDNMETRIWQEVILPNADWIFIPKGRVSYTPFNITIRGGMTRFPSALIGVGVEAPEGLEGITLRIK